MSRLHENFPYNEVNQIIDVAMKHAKAVSYAVTSGGVVYYPQAVSFVGFSSKGVAIDVFADVAKTNKMRTVVIKWNILGYYYDTTFEDYIFSTIPPDIAKKLAEDIAAIVHDAEEVQRKQREANDKEDRRKKWEELNKEFAPQGCTIRE